MQVCSSFRFRALGLSVLFQCWDEKVCSCLSPLQFGFRALTGHSLEGFELPTERSSGFISVPQQRLLPATCDDEPKSSPCAGCSSSVNGPSHCAVKCVVLQESMYPLFFVLSWMWCLMLFLRFSSVSPVF